jgi:Protein of unknwon function (DUF3310)
MNVPADPSAPPFKYDEVRILKELRDYIEASYDQSQNHYVGEDNVQAMDLIAASGHGIGFCVGDLIKYSSRYGKKKGQERKDIFKILHYAMFLLYFHDKQNPVNKAKPQFIVENNNTDNGKHY